MPRCSAIEAGVDEGDVLFADGREQALDDGGLERRDVVLGELAQVLDLDALELAVEESCVASEPPAWRPGGRAR